jgi:hypothetical protein
LSDGPAPDRHGIEQKVEAEGNIGAFRRQTIDFIVAGLLKSGQSHSGFLARRITGSGAIARRSKRYVETEGEDG